MRIEALRNNAPVERVIPFQAFDCQSVLTRCHPFISMIEKQNLAGGVALSLGMILVKQAKRTLGLFLDGNMTVFGNNVAIESKVL